MSEIFKARENIGIANKRIGSVMFGQILTDIMEEARSGDRILFAATLHEATVVNVMQCKSGEYRLKKEQCTRGDLQFKMENYNITVRIINVAMYSDEDIMRKTMGCLWDKVVIADASWVSRDIAAYLSSRCRSKIGEKDREAITLITSNVGWRNSNIMEDANIFEYKERSIR
jgi:hypothetical protein